MHRSVWVSGWLVVMGGLLGCSAGPSSREALRQGGSHVPEGEGGEERSSFPVSEGAHASSVSLEERFAPPTWLRAAEAQGQDPVPLGLGELRAHRPGERERRERRLRLTEQRVRVRVTGPLAVTEVEQAFRNEEPVQLEGVYRFVLPAGARLRSLALEVNGRWERGSIVSRQRAERIWRGVIRQATPRTRRRVEGEWIWVPGPWRDPALLQWSRGGRVELRIFPIPPRGVRRVRIVYEEHLRPEGTVRRYRFPLPASATASERIGSFHFEWRAEQLPSAPRSVGRSRLEVLRGEGDGWLARFAAHDLMPRGALVLQWEEPERRELRWWTHRGAGVASPPGPESREAKSVLSAQRSFAEDERPYVLFALRPDWLLGASGVPIESAEPEHGREVILWLDGSRSMVGERWRRAGWVAAALVASLSERDRVTVVACDFLCRMWPAGRVSGGEAAAEAVRAFVGSFEPAGWSEPVGALHWLIRRARQRVAGAEARPVHLIHVGDGVVTAGAAQQASLRDVLRGQLPPRWRLHTVAVGLESDRRTLSLLAEVGGGRFVSYTPGRSLAEVTAALRAAMDGEVVRDVEVSFGGCLLQDVAPTRLPNLLVGEEVLLAARRMRGKVDCLTRLEMVVQGTLDGRRVRRTYDLSALERGWVDGAEAPFVARQWAAARLRELEADSKWRDRAIGLSRAFGVLGRDTSLLVLESPAMFRAFGVDRTERSDFDWGEGAEAVAGEAGGWAPARRRAATTGSVPPRRARSRRRAASSAGAAVLPRGRRLRCAFRRRSASSRCLPSTTRLRIRSGLSASEAARAERRVRAAEAALAERPDSRDRHRALVRALAWAAELSRAEEAARRWLRRDPMDPEALTYLSDVVGRQGRRLEAVRLLTGIVDLAPEAVPLLARLARGFSRGSWHVPACLAWMRLWEVASEGNRRVRGISQHDLLLRAKRCMSFLVLSRQEGSSRAAPNFSGIKPLRDERPGRGRPALSIEASWQSEDGSSEDLDLSLVTPQGTRVWWLGGRRTVFGTDGMRAGAERIGLRRLSPGTYRVEIGRLDTSGSMRTLAPVRGTVRIASRHAGRGRQMPFTLPPVPGARVHVATLVVRTRQELEDLPVGTVSAAGDEAWW